MALMQHQNFNLYPLCITGTILIKHMNFFCFVPGLAFLGQTWQAPLFGVVVTVCWPRCCSFLD